MHGVCTVVTQLNMYSETVSSSPKLISQHTWMNYKTRTWKYLKKLFLSLIPQPTIFDYWLRFITVTNENILSLSVYWRGGKAHHNPGRKMDHNDKVKAD